MAIANFTNGPYGWVLFSPYESGAIVSIKLWSLPANKKLGFHIHEYGDITRGCESLGAHWNPYGKNHGSIFIDAVNRHAGDLINNLAVNEFGRFEYTYFDNLIIPEKIIGRSIVIHSGEDDLGLSDNKESKITGNAGARLACAIIGLKNPNF